MAVTTTMVMATVGETAAAEMVEEASEAETAAEEALGAETEVEEALGAETEAVEVVEVARALSFSSAFQADPGSTLFFWAVVPLIVVGFTLAIFRRMSARRGGRYYGGWFDSNGGGGD